MHNDRHGDDVVTQSTHTTAARFWRGFVGESTAQMDTSRVLLSIADETVRNALATGNVLTGSDSRGKSTATGNRPTSSLQHTRDGVLAYPAMSLPLTIKPAPRTTTLHPLQEWEGYVTEITEDEFVARLIDITAGLPYESEEAVIPFAEVSDHEALDMDVGSIFRWVIGYERASRGIRKLVSRIVIRDLPRMTERELREGREWAHRVGRTLDP